MLILKSSDILTHFADEPDAVKPQSYFMQIAYFIVGRVVK